MIVDAVFEGGGVRGIAFLGAIEEMEKMGYEWGNLAGTSAGSIIAALLAAGFTNTELMELFLSFPFQEIEKRTGICKIPMIGPYITLRLYNGLFSADIIEKWVAKSLRAKGITTFADLPQNKLRIVVTDLTRNRVTILPDDLGLYNIPHETFPVARAVRMSCSIPFILQPIKLSESIIVDGGVLSNFPLWVFDSPGIPTRPVFGFRLSSNSNLSKPKEIRGPIDLSVALVRTMLDGHDNRYIETQNAARTIFIKGIKVGVTQFDLSMPEKLELVELGRKAVRDFLSKWNFQIFIRKHYILDKVINLK